VASSYSQSVPAGFLVAAPPARLLPCPTAAGGGFVTALPQQSFGVAVHPAQIGMVR
jgi:hypothetical protein